jgi:hypothetical protein
MAILVMILGFICWWPIGLVILGFLIARGRFGPWRGPSFVGSGPMCGWGHNADQWSHGMDRWDQKIARMQEKMDRVRAKMERFKGHGDWWRPASASSGNRAFDEYRSETLKRLEEEQREFRDFLERLRFAKDRSEFDQFMNERRNRPPEQPGPPPQA